MKTTFRASAGLTVIQAALLACSALPVTGFAQQTSTAATPPATPSFRIRGFELTGDIPLPAEETTRILAPFISNQATIDTLQKASAALENALKERGFALHRVSLPPQEVGDKVTLTIVKFVIGKVTVEGAKFNSEQNIRRSVPELQEGEAPSFKRLAVQTAIANENPNKRIQVGLKESEEPDRIDVRVQVVDERPLSFSVGLSNTGNESSGRDRMALVAGHNNVLGLDHQASLAFTTSLERSNDVKQFGLSYKIPFYGVGGVLGASYTNSDVVGQFGSFSSSGVGETYGINYSHYLQPSGGTRSYLTAGLEDKTFNASKLSTIGGGVTYFPGGGTPIHRKSQPLTLGFASRTLSDLSAFNYSVNWAGNFAGGNGNTLAAYQAEDPRIQTASWNALRGDISYTRTIGSGWLLGTKSQFQFTSDALISGEQFGLGGSASVRGTSERPISGDSGVFASLELSTPELVPGLRLAGFLDAGVLSSNNTGGVTNKSATDGLSSVGLGLRYGAGNVGLTAEWGRVVRGANVPLSAPTGLPKQGDEKLHVNLTARF